MKNTKTVSILVGLLMSLTLSGCVATWTTPSMVISGPAPVVVSQPVVGIGLYPETYIWDGFEYVGVAGGEYMYLGPSGFWYHCEPWRLERFHGWERGHGNWKSHSGHDDHFNNGGSHHH